jgi:nitrite reductase/ring-hydroxylating ferredoxin subunit
MQTQRAAGHPTMNDSWFPVELSAHVQPGEIVQSSLQGQELALWRSADGAVRAWENRCPHRSVRLTLGFIAEDQLVCRYHGWRYGADGRCASVPSTPTLAPPPSACVQTYLCREADGVVWVSLSLMPAGYPPRMPGAPMASCRGFMLDIDLAALTEAIRARGFVSATHTAIWQECDGNLESATLLLQPIDEATTFAHVFIPAHPDIDAQTARQLAVSRRMKSFFASLAKTRHRILEVRHGQ